MAMSLKLAAPLSIASVICNVVLLAICMHSHVRFSAMQTLQVGGPGRALLENQSDQPSLQATVARLAQEVDHLQNQFDSRILQVERQTAEHAASLESLTASQKWHVKGKKSNTRPHASSARNGSTYYLHAPSGIPARDDPKGTAAPQPQPDAADANFEREVRHEIFLQWSEMRAVNSTHSQKINDIYDDVARLRTELTSLDQGIRTVEPRPKVDNTTMSLSPVQDPVNNPRRRAQGAELELEPDDPLVMDPLSRTVARLQKAVDTHGARLVVVEKVNAELKALLTERAEGHGGTGYDSLGGVRRMQTDGGNLHPQAAGPRAEPMFIIKPNVTSIATVVRDGNTGHRRAQEGYGYGEGTCADLERRSREVTRVCCEEPTEDCSGGYPHTCNARCAATFLPFWDDCRFALGKASQQFEPVVALCSSLSASMRPSLAEQLNVQCTDGTPTSDCVPECTQAYHGYLMLLTIDGEDSKLGCELHHGFYSWFGAAVRSSIPFGIVAR